jgi:hypothetical protein
LNYCTDCKYCLKSFSFDSDPVCIAPVVPEQIDLTNGKIVVYNKSCHYMRHPGYFWNGVGEYCPHHVEKEKTLFQKLIKLFK